MNAKQLIEQLNQLETPDLSAPVIWCDGQQVNLVTFIDGAVMLSAGVKISKSTQGTSPPFGMR